MRVRGQPFEQGADELAQLLRGEEEACLDRNLGGLGLALGRVPPYARPQDVVDLGQRDLGRGAGVPLAAPGLDFGKSPELGKPFRTHVRQQGAFADQAMADHQVDVRRLGDTAQQHGVKAIE